MGDSFQSWAVAEMRNPLRGIETVTVPSAVTVTFIVNAIAQMRLPDQANSKYNRGEC